MLWLVSRRFQFLHIENKIKVCNTGNFHEIMWVLNWTQNNNMSKILLLLSFKFDCMMTCINFIGCKILLAYKLWRRKAITPTPLSKIKLSLRLKFHYLYKIKRKSFHSCTIDL